MKRGVYFLFIAHFHVLAYCFALEVDEELFQEILTRFDSLEKKNAKLEESVTTIKEENTALREHNEALQDDVDQLRQTQISMQMETKSKIDNYHKRLILGQNLPVAFTARIKPKLVDHVSPQARIPFNDVLTNYGGGFNTSTSIFVAPMAGIYMFSCSLMDHFMRPDGSGDMLHADILKNGNTVLGRVFAHAEGVHHRDQGAQTVFTQLMAGDQVWVRDWDSKDLSVGGELYSTFSGYLLWPLE